MGNIIQNLHYLKTIVMQLANFEEHILIENLSTTKQVIYAEGRVEHLLSFNLSHWQWSSFNDKIWCSKNFSNLCTTYYVCIAIA